MKVLAIDPGPSSSGMVVLDGRKIKMALVGSNDEVMEAIDLERHGSLAGDVLAIEMIEARGMAVAAETFDTAFMAGMFCQAWVGGWEGRKWEKVYRRRVKSFLCGSQKAKDSNIRQAIIDLYGGKEKAIGNAKNKGPLYGIKSHCWAALAVGLTYLEGQK